jgi:hypothetical protein
VLPVVLGRKDVTAGYGDLITAGRASVDSRVWRRYSRCVQGVKSRVGSGRQETAVLVEGHGCTSMAVVAAAASVAAVSVGATAVGECESAGQRQGEAYELLEHDDLPFARLKQLCRDGSMFCPMPGTERLILTRSEHFHSSEGVRKSRSALSWN